MEQERRHHFGMKVHDWVIRCGVRMYLHDHTIQHNTTRSSGAHPLHWDLQGSQRPIVVWRRDHLFLPRDKDPLMNRGREGWRMKIRVEDSGVVHFVGVLLCNFSKGQRANFALCATYVYSLAPIKGRCFTFMGRDESRIWTSFLSCHRVNRDHCVVHCGATLQDCPQGAEDLLLAWQ